MPWWGWLVIGIGLLGVEMFVIDAQFYLVFLGVSAAIVGLIGLGGITLPYWAQWLLFAAFAILSMVAFRRRVYEKIRGRSGHVEQRLTMGDRVLVPQSLAPGQSCRVEYRGTSWNARNSGERLIEAGTEATIAEIDGLTLRVL